MENRAPEVEHPRVGIIQAVTTPLGFFVLAVLVIEVVLGGLSAITGNGDRSLLIWGMLILLGALILVVAFLAYFKPEVVQNRLPETPYSLLIAAPTELESLNVSTIDWNNEECFLVGVELRESVRLVPSQVGPTLRVHIPAPLARRLSPKEPYHLELVDEHGLRWRVAPFYFFESLRYLSLVDTKERILEIYGDDY
jgi:hypothetical protein